jgi:enoyl-CoA hydratase/carnithine racemase
MTDGRSSDLVSRHRDGRVLVITMQREAKRNAVDRALADAISEALDELDDDPDLWCGVLTGGSSFFSAGSDLTAGGDYITERGGEYGIIRRQRRTPLIAAVEGFALGGGLEIVLACDLVVASRSARFGLPEVTIGVVPTCAGLFRAPRSLPLNLARELILTGEPIDAERAHAAGFVNVVTEPGAALDGALALARRICRNAPLSVRACLAAIDAQLATADDAGWEATNDAKAAIAGTADVDEGVRSFLEKRPPEWQAR